MKNLLKILYELKSLLLPEYCIGCHSYGSKFLCNDCKKFIIPIEPESFVTRIPNNDWSVEEEYRNRVYLEKVFYFLEYNTLIHNIITAIKYKGSSKFIPYLMNIVFNLETFKNIDFNQFDYITYIPITTKKQRARGFNQSKEIGLCLSLKIKKEVFQIIEKIKETPNQVDLSQEDRIKNLSDCFILKKKLPIKLQGNESILLVDDICTTGTTLIKASQAIKKEYKNIKIYGFCISRGKLR